jgi:DNA-binding IclR family transcriptional regulator
MLWFESAGMQPSAELQTLRRGLDALAFINVSGTVNLASVARHLGVPHANAYRILQTLAAGGYCKRIPNSKLYMVGPRACDLSAGFGEGELLTSSAIEVVQELGQSLKWPVTLATPEGVGMRVRFTTDSTTPLALERIPVGSVSPRLVTTTGILCLAFTGEPERTALKDKLLEAGQVRQFLSSARELDDMIKSCRRDRYLIIDWRFPEGSLGVPVVRDGRPIGGLVMRYIKRGLTRERVLATYLPRLTDAVEEILRRMDALRPAAPVGPSG